MLGHGVAGGGRLVEVLEHGALVGEGRIGAAGVEKGQAHRGLGMALVGGLFPPVLGLLEVLLRLADEVAAAELELALEIAAQGLFAELVQFAGFRGRLGGGAGHLGLAGRRRGGWLLLLDAGPEQGQRSNAEKARQGAVEGHGLVSPWQIREEGSYIRRLRHL
ncbi:hypothetical protein D9M68_736840 [compost metagenome]